MSGSGGSNEFASLFGDPSGSGSGGGGGLLSMLTGDASGGGLEGLLNSPLIRQQLGTTGNRLLTMFTVAMTAQRRMKQIWKIVKPFVPIIFIGLLLYLASTIWRTFQSSVVAR